MNKTKFLILGALGGLIILSCSMFEAAESVVVIDDGAYLAKLPWDAETFLFAVGDKRAELYNNAGTTRIGQIYFDGDSDVLTFDIENSRRTADLEAAHTYAPSDNSLSNYKITTELNGYFSKDDIVVVRLDGITKGYLDLKSIRRVTTNTSVSNGYDDTTGEDTDDQIEYEEYKTNWNNTTYLFTWTTKTTNDLSTGGGDTSTDTGDGSGGV